jgi:hypothetical protein
MKERYNNIGECTGARETMKGKFWSIFGAKD